MSIGSSGETRLVADHHAVLRWRHLRGPNITRVGENHHAWACAGLGDVAQRDTRHDRRRMVRQPRTNSSDPVASFGSRSVLLAKQHPVIVMVNQTITTSGAPGAGTSGDCTLGTTRRPRTGRLRYRIAAILSPEWRTQPGKSHQTEASK